MKEPAAVGSQTLAADGKHQIVLSAAAMIDARNALPLMRAPFGDQLYSVCARGEGHSAKMTVDYVASTDLAGRLPRVIGDASTSGRCRTVGVEKQRNSGQALDVFA